MRPSRWYRLQTPLIVRGLFRERYRRVLLLPGWPLLILGSEDNRVANCKFPYPWPPPDRFDLAVLKNLNLK